MLAIADTFAEVSLMVHNRMVEEGRTHLGFAYAVNGTLSIEIYLKCLLRVLSIQIPRTHNLKELFEQLDCQTKSRLKGEHDRRRKG